MHKQINCVQVNANDPNERARMQTFAESFDHTIGSWRWPICEMKRGDYTFGYAQIVQSPVFFTAWNPNTCKPRDFHEGLSHLRAWGLMQNGHGFATVALDNPTFTPQLMEKLGFNRMKLELYEAY